MPKGNGVQADERAVGFAQHRALAPRPADGIGAVQDHEPHARLGARLHRQRHRPNEGVDAHAHVLEVEEEGVEAVEHGGRRFADLAVKRVDRQARDGIGVVVRLDHVVLLLAARAVLGAEEGTKIEAGCADRVGGEDEVGGDRRGVDDEAQTCTAEPGRIAVPANEDVEPGQNAWPVHRRLRVHRASGGASRSQ